LLGEDHDFFSLFDRRGLKSGDVDGTAHRTGADGEGGGFTITVST